MDDVTATDRSEEPGILPASVSQKLVSLASCAVAAVRDADHAKSIMEYFSIDLKSGACVATRKSVFGDQCFVPATTSPCRSNGVMGS